MRTSGPSWSAPEKTAVFCDAVRSLPALARRPVSHPAQHSDPSASAFLSTFKPDGAQSPASPIGNRDRKTAVFSPDGPPTPALSPCLTLIRPHSNRGLPDADLTR